MTSLADIISGGKARISLDVEEVLATINDAILARINEVKGTHYTGKDWTSYEDLSCIGVTYQEFHSIWEDIWNNHRDRIKPLVDPTKLASLLELYDVDIVTARCKDSVDATELWLKENYKELDTVKRVVVEDRRSKITYDYTIYVDDSPVLAADVKNTPGRVQILVGSYYTDNPVYDNYAENVIKVKDTNAALDLLISLKAKAK